MRNINLFAFCCCTAGAIYLLFISSLCYGRCNGSAGYEVAGRSPNPCRVDGLSDYVLLSGHIANKQTDIKIESPDGMFTHTLTIDKYGDFSDTLRVTAGIYWMRDFSFNAVSLYLDRGYHLKINADMNAFKSTLVIKGKGAQITNYLLVKEGMVNKMRAEGASFYESEETAYKSRSQQIRSTMTRKLDSIAGIDATYKAREKMNLTYEHWTRLNTYLSYHVHYHPGLKVSDTFFNEFTDLSYDEAVDYMFSADYRQLVADHYRKKAAELARSAAMPQEIASLQVYAAIPNDTIKNDLLFKSAAADLMAVTEPEAYYASFMKASTKRQHKAVITDIYNRLKKLSKGQPSPGFVDYENNDGRKTSLVDFRGKYVYVDVWATWCGPCRAETPFLEEIEEKYRGKNIEFVSISVDVVGSHDTWKKMIADKKMRGIQLLSNNDWKSDFIQDYLIKSIPRFILIDPAGNIVSANAPRPSSPEIHLLLDKLL